MLEIIALIFLSKQIARLAIQKGLKPGQWKLFLVLAWFSAEIFGLVIGATLFGFNENNIIPLMLLALACAFGGYLFIRATLLKKPDAMDDEINRIGTEDLTP
ncbi:MAG: hypothetical protein JSU03_00695 [Bacteroidetes bacterium]|nr:hypothetical protein [Bacteroidota bacterium]MBS1755770.1 hypothetical protein [Bacteroidota bacterium]